MSGLRRMNVRTVRRAAEKLQRDLVDEITAEGRAKTVDELIVEAWLWERMGAPRFAAQVRVMAENERMRSQ